MGINSESCLGVVFCSILRKNFLTIGTAQAWNGHPGGIANTSLLDFSKHMREAISSLLRDLPVLKFYSPLVSVYVFVQVLMVAFL